MVKAHEQLAKGKPASLRSWALRTLVRIGGMVERGESRPDGGGNSTRGDDEGRALSGAYVSCTDELLETDSASGSNWKTSRDHEFSLFMMIISVLA